MLIKYRKENWDKILKERVYSAEALIRNTFDEKISLIFELKKNIQAEIGNSKFENLYLDDDYSLFEKGSVAIEVYDANSDLIYWTSEKIIKEHEDVRNLNEIGQAVFKSNGLKTFLTISDTLKKADRTLYLFIGLPVESYYNLSNIDYTAVNISDSLSHVLSTSVKINFNPNAPLSLDGRFHSFALLNNYKNKIAVVDYEKPALDNELIELENILNAVQSFIILLFFLWLAWITYPKIKESNRRSIKFLSYLFFIVFLRLILFLAGFPSSYIANELTSSSNFSSTFAFGIVRSPIELTITVIFGFAAVLSAFGFFTDYYDKIGNEKRSWKKFIIALPVGAFLVLLTIRGLGASLRSVVFDSSIRYFKEFNLIPDAPTFLMNFNILVIGFSAILFCLINILFVSLYVPVLGKKKSYIWFSVLFVVIQVFGWFFDHIQKQPQGTPLIRILLITILFLLAFLLIFKNYRSIIKYLYIAVGASIATVSLLTYYNSEIERESLKTTAQDLTRSNENIYRFMVFQTLTNIQNDESIKDALTKKENMNSVAFVEWTKSLLYRETIPVIITFYNGTGEQIGSFSSFLENKRVNNLPDINKIKEIPKVDLIPNVFTGEINISGSTVIKNKDKIIGYVGINVIYDENHFNFVNIPKFLFAERSGISSAVDLEQLKIFFFDNGVLDRTFGSAALSEDDINKITNAKFTKHNEAWLELNISGENYLSYIFNVDESNSKILAVAKEKKNFSWNLSDFFKVFFVHTIIILVASICLALWNFRKLKIFLNSYRTKLAAAFVIVSVIPLIVVTIYFQSITEDKNTELIYGSLGVMANQIENYLNLYAGKSSVQPEMVFKKAVDDLGINYSVFKSKRIVYSSTIDFYKTGLLTNIIPFNIWHQLFPKGLTNTFETKRIGNQQIHSYYLKMIGNDQPLIIVVNDQFNKVSLPLSDTEVDIFMFGVFSLALIMLIIFSTILAEQISSPIRRLTNATRSLGSGDLNIEVEGNYSGEIAELTNGFNKMIKQLRKSQIEMAQLERETAWKEMAKQVAHEIKNPLTPMKLSIQQLLAAYRDKSPKFDSIFEKVTSTIITQVETLRNIASEFSNFARMPKLNIERINLIGSINEAINLFANEKLEIKFENNKDVIFINADSDHLNRTFINLIRNSIQAKARNITIDVSTNKDFSYVRIIDNGTGISGENFEKIFEENYTTKPEGMGLGLSITKRFLESINGKIVVEKSSDEGTTFLITIPLVK